MTKKKTGRPKIELNEHRIENFLQAIRLGCPIKDACGCAGFSDKWFYAKKAEALKNPNRAENRAFIEFLDRIKEVEGEATQRWLAIIEKAAVGGNWQAAAWKLERRREMFIPKVKQEVKAELEGTVKVKDARAKLLDRLARIAEREDQS